MGRLLTILVNLFWRLVWWWKHRTGFIDLGRDLDMCGTVVSVEPPGDDGDFCFNLKPDFGWEWTVEAFGRRTSENPNFPGTIHCEVPPWLADRFRDVRAKVVFGAHLRVRGRWGFDGVHLGVPLFLEVLAALWRHQPNVRDGWCEVHPVESIEVLG